MDTTFFHMSRKRVPGAIIIVLLASVAVASVGPGVNQHAGTATAARPASGSTPTVFGSASDTQSYAGGDSSAKTKGTKQSPKPADQGSWVQRTPLEFALVLFYVALLLALLVVLHLVDSVQAYRFSKKTRDDLMQKLEGKISADQIVQLTRDLDELGTPTGIPGTTRSIFTYALVATLAIAVFHLLAFSRDPEASKYADKILTVLAGALSSIVGFYFGSKATREGVESGKARTVAEPPKPSGKIDEIDPKEGPPGSTITIRGTGFGDAEGTVKFGEISARRAVEWKGNYIKVIVPEGVPKGPSTVKVNPPDGSEIVGSPNLFKVV